MCRAFTYLHVENTADERNIIHNTEVGSAVLFRGFDYFEKCPGLFVAIFLPFLSHFHIRHILTETAIASMYDMLGLLLILLYTHCWAEEVCFNLTNYKIEITKISESIIDGPVGLVSCSGCILKCQYAQETDVWFNGSFGCLEANISHLNGNTQINITYPNNMCTLYPCDVNITALMHSLSVDKEGLMELFYIRRSCKNLFSQSSPHDDLKKLFMRMEMKMIHNIMETSTSKSTSYDLKDVGIKVVKISEKDLIGDSRIGISVAELLPQNKTFIPEVWFPANALHKIPEKKVGTVSYMWPDEFMLKPVNISSMVIRIELLGGTRLQHLDPPIEMVFRNVVQIVSENDTFDCHYFDEHGDNDIYWKKDGCKTQINLTDIICSCSHTTPFAVLLISTQIDPIHWQILSYISYIGCGLSAFFTALSIAIFLFSNQKADHSLAIHVSLSGALLLLNTIFLLTEWGATVEPDWVCVFVAAALHYSLLCSFTWMALEAVHLYLMLIKVFNTNYKHYMFKMSATGWGIPAIIVSISVGVNNSHFYGMKETVMANSNQTSAICWIVDDSYFYSVNLVYFTLIFIFNSGILMAVASSICKMKPVFRKVKNKKWRDPDRFSESCKSGLTVLGLTCLMGTTWGLAFLGSGYVNYPVLYLFCIFNSTQGFFIFIWICLSTNKQRKREREDKMTSTPTKSSTTKTE